MKRILLLLIFLLPFLSNAQNDWAPVGAKWWYGRHDVALSGPPPYAEWYSITESLTANPIHGKDVREISVDACSFCNPCYVYSDSNRVYYYNIEFETFFLLYDLNLIPGESWSIYHSDFNTPTGIDSIIINVTDTASVVISGITLKKQFIEVESNYFDFGDAIIEKIGNIISFLPIDNGWCDSGYDPIRCYIDSVNGIYLSNGNCEFTDVGISETKHPLFEIFPNPAQDFLYLNNNSQKLNYKILDYTGRLILSGKTEKEINVQTLSPGYYRVVFEDEVSRAFFKM